MIQIDRSDTDTHVLLAVLNLTSEDGYRRTTTSWPANVRASWGGACCCADARNGSWKCNVLPSNGGRSRDHGETYGVVKMFNSSQATINIQDYRDHV